MCPAVQSSTIAAWNKNAIGNVRAMVIADWNIISFIYNVAEKSLCKKTRVGREAAGEGGRGREEN